LQHGSDKTQETAGEWIVMNYLDDPSVTKIISTVANISHPAKTLSALSEKSKNKETRGNATYWKIEKDIDHTDSPDDGKPLPAKDAQAKFASLDVQVDSLVAEFGEINLINRAGKSTSTITEAAKKQKYFLDKLVVGKTLPDVET